jgi:hypothetical protein
LVAERVAVKEVLTVAMAIAVIAPLIRSTASIMRPSGSLSCPRRWIDRDKPTNMT